MPLKTSYFNKGIFLNNIKRYWLITFSYAFFLFLFAMGYLNSEIMRMDHAANQNTINQIGRIFKASNDLMPIFLGFYTIVAALAVFSYMQFPRNTAMVHSLPVTRETLYVTNYLSGFFLVVFPIFLNSCILFIAETVLGLPYPNDILMWFGVNLVLTFLLYTFAVFTGMFTGHLAAQAIFFYIFNFIAIFLEFMIGMALDDFLFGYINNRSQNFEVWSPLFYSAESIFPNFYSNQGPITAALIGYLIAGIIFLISGMVLYKKRQLEVATDVISFPAVKPIFKYSATFCSSILIGNIIVSILNMESSLGAYIAAYLVGGLIGYFACEMLLQKTFRVFKAYKGFIAFGVILSLLILGVNFDLFGYERHIPQDSEVELMCISPYRDSRFKLALRPEDYDPQKDRYLINYNHEDEPPRVLTDAHIDELRKEMQGIVDNREAITLARQIHDYIVRNEALFKENEATAARLRASSNDEELQNNFIDRSLYFAYRLNDGTLIERQYYLKTYKNNTELDELLRKYLSIPGVRERYEPIIGKTAADIERIILYYSTVDGSSNDFELNENIQDFLTAYQQDILALDDPLESMFDRPATRKKGYIDITFEFKDKGILLNVPRYSKSLHPGYKNTLNYLIEKGIIDPQALPE
ncbi:MAG TPA: hypothetical protein DD738_15335 [Ruminiclostridium sp.]|nr:hypothetical protein [Ruminiclostridium sp.]